MKRIIYVGEKDRGYYISEVAIPSNGLEVTYIESGSHFDNELISKIGLEAAKGGVDYIIYDVRGFIDDAEVIANSILAVKKTNSAMPIIQVETINEHNVMVRTCLDKGLQHFINTGVGTAADMKKQLKEQLLMNVTGYYDANGRKDIEEVKKKRQAAKEKKSRYKTIGVVGACHRIGTTTQAIQITKYLSAKGYKACYIELNDNMYENRQLTRKEKQQLSFMEKTRLMFDMEIDEPEHGYIRYQGVDCYYRQELLSEVLDRDYDFFVYDYGVYTAGGFNKAAFLRDSLQIFCVGANTAEADYAFEIATNPSYQNAELLFSFTAEGDREEIRKMFDEFGAGDRCDFTNYTPNPYILADFDMYSAMIEVPDKADPEEAAEKPEPKKKKHLLFRRK